MNKFLLINLLLITFAFAETPRKIGLLIGGGRGEFDPLNEVFMKQGSAFAENLVQKKYEVRGAFGPSFFSDKNFMPSEKPHYEEAWSSGKFQPATVKSIEENLDWLLQEIAAGRIKKGDSVVIQISTHGSPKGIDEVGHEIVLPTNGEGEKSLTYPLSTKVNDVIQKLNDLEVQTAILDFSCFSGSSIDLAKNRQNVCVISSTNRYNPAQATFEGDQNAGTLFWNAVQGSEKPQTLESLFLSYRMKDETIDIPEISSQENERIRKIWDLLFAQYTSSVGYPNRLQHIAPILECSEIGSTLPLNDFKMFETLMIETLKSDKKFTELKVIADRIRKFASIRDSISPYVNTVLGNLTLGKYKRVTPISFGSCRKFYDKIGNVTSLDEKLSSSIAQIEFLKKPSPSYAQWERERSIQEVQEDMSNTKLLYEACTTQELKDFMSPKMATQINSEEEFFKLKEDQDKLEEEFRKKERQVYSELYKNFSESSTTSNACKKFLL